MRSSLFMILIPHFALADTSSAAAKTSRVELLGGRLTLALPAEAKVHSNFAERDARVDLPNLSVYANAAFGKVTTVDLEKEIRKELAANPWGSVAEFVVQS